MANFNLADYETVEERIRRFYADNPEGRIMTQNLTTEADRVAATWIVQAFVFTGGDLPKASGLAFEVDGVGMANKTSALENAETSAIGRALANAGYSGNKRASREEMEKVARGAGRDFLAEADAAALKYDLDGLRLIYADARSAKTDAVTLEKIEAYARELKQV